MAQEVSQKAFSENTENTVVNATREASQLFFLPTAIGVFSEIQGSNQYWSMDPDKVAEMARDLVKKLENHKGTQEQKEQIVKNFLEQSGLESNTEQMDNALLAVKSVTENLPVETISTLDKLHNEKLKRFFAENGESLINDLENSKGEIAFFIRDDAATNNYRIKKIQDKIDGTYSGGPPDEVIAIFLPVFAMIPIAILAMDSSAASFIYDNPFLYYAGFASLIYGTLKIFRKKYHPGLQQISQIKMEIANNEKSLTTDLSRIELKQRAAKNEITSIDEIIDNYYRASICDGVLSRVK